jgi:hypothetical protein
MKMEKTECSETSAYKIQTPGNYPEESIQQGLHSFIVLAFVILQSFQIYTDKEESTLFYGNYELVTIRMPCNLDKCNSALNYTYSIN